MTKYNKAVTYSKSIRLAVQKYNKANLAKKRKDAFLIELDLANEIAEICGREAASQICEENLALENLALE